MTSNLNDPRHPWARLTSASRTVRDERDVTAPYGFATRVAALAFAQEERMASLFDRFALRALGVSCLLALGSVALNYDSLTAALANPGAARPVMAANAASSASFDEVMLPTTDAVAVVFDIAD